MGTGGTKIEKPKIVIDFENISKNQYFCPKCKRIPEILNIHSLSGHIELMCKIHGEIDLTVEDYLNQIKMHFSDIICENCRKKKESKKERFKYCYYCENYFCEKCLIDESIHPIFHLNESQIENDKFLHCKDCEENFNKKKFEENHKNHETLELKYLRNEVRKYRDIILEKNTLLSNIINLNKIILNSYDNNQNNYNHMKSIINLGKSIEEENQNNSTRLQEKSIISLKNQFSICLDGNERILDLRNKNIGDEGLKLISRIKFKNLKTFVISKNNIKNTQPLSYMDLPNLEYLNINDNEIEDIEPITQINSNKLKEICLMNNKIEQIGPTLQFDYPNIERIRIEGNPLSYDSAIFKKYSKLLSYKSMPFEVFKEKYECHISPNDEVLNLSSLKRGDTILNDLYLLIPDNNEIKILKLDNNNIKDLSILSRIPLYNLKVLDLSLNEITNLKFLKEMNLKNLNALYLNYNYINDISPLITNLKYYPKLKILSLNKNNFNVDEKKNKELLKILKERNIECEYN